MWVRYSMWMWQSMIHMPEELPLALFILNQYRKEMGTGIRMSFQGVIAAAGPGFQVKSGAAAIFMAGDSNPVSS